jgi:ABC-type Fe3+-hydroxamate transport system substrate-binding protein
VANVEENREQDVAALRAAGIPVWVTYPRTVDEAFASLRRLAAALLPAGGVPAWLVDAEAAWASIMPQGYGSRAAIPVWRKPWVVLGHDTFAGDVLHRLGVSNVYGDAPERYPRPSLDEINARRPDLVVMPDEPYAFTATDGPEAFPGVACALVSGRHLTWYGPSLAQAPALLRAQLGAARLY